MKLFISLNLLLIFINSFSQSEFDEYFTGQRLRFDYTIVDKSNERLVETTAVYKELLWSGSRVNLIDSFLYGQMRLKLFDSATGVLIYSKGFTTLYNEWQTINSKERNEITIRESLVLPFPRKPAILTIAERGSDQEFNSIFSQRINPNEYNLFRGDSSSLGEYRKLVDCGKPENMLDIVFLSEGYTLQEKESFFAEAGKHASNLTRWKPYDEYSDKINISAYFIPSAESGVSDPCDSTFLSTAFQISFNTLGIERYLMPSNIFLLRDQLKTIDYDQICVMVNSDKYGGGGIYNYLTVFTSRHVNSEFLFQHEFAHTLAGLADEYYSSQVTYSTMFPKQYEPYQPNITTLVDFDSKWKYMIHDTVPVPTPNLRLYNNVVGVFEGAGYSAEGIYRSYYNCSMKSAGADGFCPVCRKAICRMLDYYCE